MESKYPLLVLQVKIKDYKLGMCMQLPRVIEHCC